MRKPGQQYVQMKHAWMAIVVILLLICIVAPGAAATESAVVSKISEVTVFTQHAIVTRSGAAAVTEGPNRLLVQTEAFNIVGDSVNAAVFGDGEILGVQVVRVPVQEMPQEKIRELISKVQLLEEQKRVFEDARKALLRQEAFLNGFVDSTGKQGDDTQSMIPSTENLEKYLLFFDKKYTDIYDRRREIDSDISSVEKEIEQLRRELSMRRETEQKTRIAIEILFNAKKPQQINIEASYRVDRVRWSPVYRASIDASLKGVDLAMMAEITQTTGEDWSDVTLTVSNAVPVSIGRLPELSPWWLDYQQPPSLKQERTMRSRSMEMEMSADSMVMAAPPAEAMRRETALSFEYTMPLPVTIVSREEQTHLPVLTRSLEGEFYHYTVPTMSPDAYLVCEAKADRELLPGPVNIFFDNRYTGRMVLEEKGPGDTFTLGLGIDRAVKVKREKLKDKSQETAFFGRIERDSIIRELSYRVVAQNLSDRPVVLKLMDRVPVSRTDRITVKDLVFSQAPDMRDVDEKSGVMLWDLKLNAGATSEITTDFTVTYPKDMPKPVF